jgi:aminopeptidase N
MYRVHTSFLSIDEQAGLQISLEKSLLNQLESTRDAGQSRLFFNAFCNIARTSPGLAYLNALWTGSKQLETLPLSETDLVHLAEILALRQPENAARILATQRKQIKNPDLLRRFDFVTPALSPEASVRDRFFHSLKEPQNRTTEKWVLDALTYLHHPSRLDESEKYILPSLELLEEIQVTGDIFFPSGWLNNTLLNYRSPTAVTTVYDFLAQRPDYNPQLRMKILQAIDMADRASHYQIGNQHTD